MQEKRKISLEEAKKAGLVLQRTVGPEGDTSLKHTDILKGLRMDTFPDVYLYPDGKYHIHCYKSNVALPKAQRNLNPKRVAKIIKEFHWGLTNSPRLHIVEYVTMSGRVLGYLLILTDGQHTIHAYDVGSPTLPDFIDGSMVYGLAVPLLHGSVALTFIAENKNTVSVEGEDQLHAILTCLNDSEYENVNTVSDEDKDIYYLGRRIAEWLMDEYDIHCYRTTERDEYDDGETHRFCALYSWTQICYDLFKHTERELKRKRLNEFGDGLYSVTKEEVRYETMFRFRYAISVLFTVFGKECFMAEEKSNMDVIRGLPFVVRSFIYAMNSNKPIDKCDAGNRSIEVDRWNCYHKTDIIDALKLGRVWSSDMQQFFVVNGIDGYKKVCANHPDLRPLHGQDCRLGGSSGWFASYYYCWEKMLKAYFAEKMSKPSLYEKHKIPTHDEFQQAKEKKKKGKKKSQEKPKVYH